MDLSDFDPKKVTRALGAASVEKPRRVPMSNPQGQRKYARLYVIDVPGKGSVEICAWLDGSGWWFERLQDGLAALRHAVNKYERRPGDSQAPTSAHQPQERPAELPLSPLACEGNADAP
jgi:hypothetical protein